jgi:LuxR family transcriptional activator of conjugal transfer of Ti plasmids
MSLAPVSLVSALPLPVQSHAPTHAGRLAEAGKAELQAALQALARDLGFHSGVYVHLGHGFSQPGFATPARFVASSPFDARLYLDEGALVHDPVRMRAARAHTPFAWSTDIALHFTQAQQQLYTRLRCRGIHAGVAAPVQDYAAGPAYLSLYSLYPDEAEQSAREQGAALAFAAAAFHERAKASMAACHPAAAGASLTPREVECLRLAALGWSGPESAAALRVTTRTIEFHLGNACEKLGAPNKVRAVALAVGWGLIEP